MKTVELVLALLLMLLGMLFRRKKDTWSILVDKRQSFEGNLLAMAEYLGRQAGVTVYVINCGKRGIDETELDAKNVKFVRHHSLHELKARLRSRQVIISHSLKPALGRYAFLTDVRIINVWHGIPIKGMGNMDRSFPRSRLAAEFSRRQDIALFCVSSEIERSFIAACHLMDASRIQALGIPRTDILIDQKSMTAGQRRTQGAIASIKSGRKMVLYAPTFRDDVTGPTGLTRAELERLNALFAQYDALFAVRPHPKEAEAYDELIAGLSHVIHADSRKWPDTNTVLLQTDLLVTDYSSIWLEFLLLDRPLIAFWWDFQQYAEKRGFLIDLDAVFPGPRALTTTELEKIFRDWFVGSLGEVQAGRPLRHHVRHLFHKHVDGRSCERLFNMMNST